MRNRSSDRSEAIAIIPPIAQAEVSKPSLCLEAPSRACGISNDYLNAHRSVKLSTKKSCRRNKSNINRV